jgi:hypothetical protein
MKRGIRIKIQVRVLLYASILAFAVSGQWACAPGYRASRGVHAKALRGSLQVIRTGMTAEEVRTLLGAPDAVFDAEFGAATGDPWTGTVWLYFLEEDKALRCVRRYKKGAFVFYPRGENMRLNHWEIES